MTGRQIARVRTFERRLTRVAVGAGGLTLVSILCPIVARWWVG